jgi:hypothetical protein
MAKTSPLAFVTRAGGKRTPRRRAVSSATVIQRSRSESSEQKAMFHNITGAGRRGTIRRFFDLGESDRQAATTALDAVLSKRVRGQA